MIIYRIKSKLLRIIRGNRMPRLVRKKTVGYRTATHISAFGWGNAGDTLLPVVLRDLFQDYLGVKKWHGKHVYKVVDGKDIETYNNGNFIVIGGGGLFLCDTNRNNLSGWQWSCSIEKLDEIRKPIVGFAIGYNRFRGQEEFQPIFTEHFNRFVEKAAFVGIRNHGSMECLKQYLRTDKLKSKLTYQPCMTTLISHIYPTLLDYRDKEDFVAFNCAFDRQNLRSVDDNYLKSIARIALALSRITEIRYYSHMPSDNQALLYFDEIGVPYKLIRFKTVRQIVQEYSKPRLVIGMRGHAQMIPFGCLTPILSIVSHDKMQWFLDDIQHPEWGADVQDISFEDELREKSFFLYNHTDEIVQEISKQQERLWSITMGNMKFINDELNKITPPYSLCLLVGFTNRVTNLNVAA